MDDLESKAVDLLESNKLRRAERVLHQMLAQDRNCLAAHFHLARVYWRTGENQKALHHARRTIRLNPKERNAHLNLGLIHELMGNRKAAIANYRKELSLNPGSPETLWNLGRLHFDSRRWQAASRHLQRCMDIGYLHEIEDTADKLGICYYRRRDVRSYIRLYSNYVRMFPGAGWAVSNLGNALLHAKNYRRAVLWLTAAKRLGGGTKTDDNLAFARKKLKAERLMNFPDDKPPGDG